MAKDNFDNLKKQEGMGKIMKKMKQCYDMSKLN